MRSPGRRRLRAVVETVAFGSRVPAPGGSGASGREAIELPFHRRSTETGGLRVAGSSGSQRLAGRHVGIHAARRHHGHSRGRLCRGPRDLPDDHRLAGAPFSGDPDAGQGNAGGPQADGAQSPGAQGVPVRSQRTACRCDGHAADVAARGCGRNSLRPARGNEGGAGQNPPASRPCHRGRLSGLCPDGRLAGLARSELRPARRRELHQ